MGTFISVKHSLVLHMKYLWKSQNALDVFRCLAGLKTVTHKKLVIFYVGATRNSYNWKKDSTKNVF